MLLGLDRISHFYGSRLVFKDVSLRIQPGSVTLLTGANGAGKSTLLKIMAGLLLPSSGSVLRGRRGPRAGMTTGTGGSPDGDQAPRLAYLGHQTFLYPELSALENLRFWTALQQRACSEQELADVLDRVELGPFAEEKVRRFSRGMAQRLNLARVFFPRPEVLLLDEPGTGLDVRSQAILHRELADARGAGAGIVWITHNPTEDLRRADMVAVLDKNTLAFYGSTRQYQERGAALPPASRLSLAGEMC
jgi:heme exporter protein A